MLYLISLPDQDSICYLKLFVSTVLERKENKVLVNFPTDFKGNSMKEWIPAEYASPL